MVFGGGILLSAAALFLALAVWQFSTYVGIGVLLVCGGEGVRRACLGMAVVIRQRGEAIARIKEAERGMLDAGEWERLGPGERD